MALWWLAQSVRQWAKEWTQLLCPCHLYVVGDMLLRYGLAVMIRVPAYRMQLCRFYLAYCGNTAREINWSVELRKLNVNAAGGWWWWSCSVRFTVAMWACYTHAHIIRDLMGQLVRVSIVLPKGSAGDVPMTWSRWRRVLLSVRGFLC
jgi:hypothetical protein